jgi:hypothetical protein
MKRALVLTALLSLLVLGATSALPAAAARNAYATHHADMIFVTPYATQVRSDLGSYTTPDVGKESWSSGTRPPTAMTSRAQSAAMNST